MRKLIVKSLLIVGTAASSIVGCKTNDGTSDSSSTTLLDVAQTSGQLASGSSFSISGSSTSTTGSTTTSGKPKGHGPGGRDGYLAGTNLLAPSDQLLAIIEAESAGDFRGLRMHAMGGATVTNYDQAGNVVTLPQPEQNGGGPEGCSFSGKQFPKFDSLLAKVARTVIDFGSGVTVDHHGTTITRSGKIMVTRSGSGSTHTETITFNNYTVNGNTIVGTKTRTSTFDSASGTGLSTTYVTNGKITFSDGVVGNWASTKQRKSTIVMDANGHPASGTIVTEGSTVITAAEGTVVYSHSVTKPIAENIACHRHAPVSGTVATTYNGDTVSVDFGDGSCTNNTVTCTLNGVTTTNTLGL